jgi:hypothetical protein
MVYIGVSRTVGLMRLVAGRPQPPGKCGCGHPAAHAVEVSSVDWPDWSVWRVPVRLVT